MSKPRIQLSDAERKIVGVVDALTTGGRKPTSNEVADAAGMDRTRAKDMLLSLRSHGVIPRGLVEIPYRPKSLKPLEPKTVKLSRRRAIRGID